jgi:hypothetical protein
MMVSAQNGGYAAGAVMRHCPQLLVRILCACIGLLLGACAGTTSDFDRVAPPVRFLEIRETASWVEGFDDAWWPKIDAAYDEYNRTINEELVAQWDAANASTISPTRC